MRFKELIHDKLIYSDSVEDSGSTDNSFDIKSYEYEFELSGSWNALKFWFLVNSNRRFFTDISLLGNKKQGL